MWNFTGIYFHGWVDFKILITTRTKFIAVSFKIMCKCSS